MPEGRTATETPAHLRDAACYICGGSEDEHYGSGDSHAFWSNRSAHRYFVQQDAQMRPATTQEARYVADWRPC